jgi:pimeloyl-ACP methyl ester carboxylesterase
MEDGMRGVLQQLEGEQVPLRHVERSPEVTETFGVLPSGSKYKIAQLEGVVVQHGLIFCHGFCPAGIPLAGPFAANDNPHRPIYLGVMLRGYVVASVSYWREGVIYGDAVEDVEEMRLLLRERGVAGRMVAQGRSMGGAICTLLNERFGQHYDGILTLGAALHVSKEQDGSKPVFSHAPRTRQIFLSNVSELAVIEAYVAQSQSYVKKPPQPKMHGIAPFTGYPSLY